MTDERLAEIRSWTWIPGEVGRELLAEVERLLKEREDIANSLGIHRLDRLYTELDEAEKRANAAERLALALDDVWRALDHEIFGCNGGNCYAEPVTLREAAKLDKARPEWRTQIEAMRERLK